MPYRPLQHQIASQAVAKVTGVWTRIGAAVEEVRRDYGEDLLVQTCLNGKMDASRIWVQVKGAKDLAFMTELNRITPIYIRADLALRWARTADLLVMVLWDVDNNCGWYVVPSLTDLHSDLVRKDRDKIAIEVHSENQFNEKSAQTIAWEARLEHLSRFVRSFRKLQQEVEDTEPGDSAWANEAVGEAVIDIMLDLGILDKEGYSRLSPEVQTDNG